MNRNFLSIAALLGALSVVLGAFAAHSLRAMAGADTVAIFETGVRYQFYHTFALFIVAFLSDKETNNKWISWAGNCFITGIILFCGSLYALTALSIEKAHNTVVGVATPIGGLFFILGWIFLYVGITRKEK